MGDLEDFLLKIIDEGGSMSVEEVVDEVSRRMHVKKHGVARSLYSLWREGRVRLVDPNPPKNLAQYFASLYNLWFWLVLSTIIIAGLTIYLLPQTTPYIYLRYIFGSLFILYLPGFTLIEGLYPKKEDLRPLERLALSVGLSLALIPLVGLLLNYTPFGIRLNPIFTSLAALTLMLGLIAVVRKYTYFRLAVEASVRG